MGRQKKYIIEKRELKRQPTERLYSFAFNQQKNEKKDCTQGVYGPREWVRIRETKWKGTWMASKEKNTS